MPEEPTIAASLSPEQRELLRQRMDELAEKAKAQFRAATRSIYGATEKGDPDQIGTGILLNIDGAKILLTAAHVVDWKDKTNLYVTGQSELVPIEADFDSIPKPKGDRDKDRLDFAAARLPQKMVSRLGHGYISLDQIRAGGTDDGGHLFTALGFPNSENESVNRERNTVDTTLLPYSSTARITRKLGARAGDEGRRHILIGYGKHSREGETKVVSTLPNGMSGGPLIDAGKPSDLSVFRGNVVPTPLLVGMVIEHWVKHSVLVATRIEVILPTLQRLAVAAVPGQS